MERKGSSNSCPGSHIHVDKLHRIAYATDASVYRELPLGVTYPESVEDVVALIAEARRRHTHLIPRAGGTSICGQVVGSGIVCDISRHWNKILEINPAQQWARVQPGVVRDELNLALKPYGLFFSPETSTSNRCCIGGMMGNNSCGAHSLVYGSTRHHLLEAEGVLSDGSVEVFRDYTVMELEERFGKRFWNKAYGECSENKTADGRSLIERIYAQLISCALDPQTVSLINDNYPDRSLRRRSCGYAIDEVIEDISAGIAEDISERKINLCRLLCGSEGTLAFITEIKVSLDPLPSENHLVVCAHCNTLEDSLLANLVALRHNPVAVELMDGQILALSANNLEQQRNRFFIEGNPAALIIAEFEGERMEENASAFEKDVLQLSGSSSSSSSPSSSSSSSSAASASASASATSSSSSAATTAHTLPNGSLAYCCTRVYGRDIGRVWDLRKAGLGVLSGMKGDAKPVGVIEDTAVSPERMPAYIADFKQMLSGLGLSCVYYGHISTGELHLRPVLNLKDPSDRKKFRQVARETALLVRKHKGSLSGEHGDGRLRGEFILLMYGAEVYGLMRSVKHTWDPSGVFNVGKITDTPPMDEYLRFVLGTQACSTDSDNLNCNHSGSTCSYRKSDYILPDKTYFTWNGEFKHGESSQYAMLCSIEQCNGAGACRKSALMGGTMCPAFKVGNDELWSTRARSNVLRELLTYGIPSSEHDEQQHSASNDSGCSFSNIVCSPEVWEMLSSCLACKGCRSECPSNVDMTRLRAELLQHRWNAKGTPLNIWMIARMAWFERLGRRVRPLYNFFAGWKPSASLIKRVVKFSSQRNIPKLSRWSMRTLVAREVKAFDRCRKPQEAVAHGRKVFLFADEFTNCQEAELGLTFARLLMRLGYMVEIPHHVESGRAAISKGCLKLAKKFAVKNVNLLSDIISEDAPLVGIEPSCILSFRDEYPDLVPPTMSGKAKALARNCLLYDEFIAGEIALGHIRAEQFSKAACQIYLHGHCHQKSLVGLGKSEQMLKKLLPDATIHTIPSGCCGMAGSFGYEKEHYQTSLKIGEMVLFPAVRKAVAKSKDAGGGPDVYVAAPGTSCRQHILDGTGVKALHPIEILFRFLLT